MDREWDAYESNPALRCTKILLFTIGKRDRVIIQLRRGHGKSKQILMSNVHAFLFQYPSTIY